MKRTNLQNTKFWWLVKNTNITELQKMALVRQYTAGRTQKSSEMKEEEMEMLLWNLRQLWESMNRMRRKIFVQIAKIKLSDEKITEQQALGYIHKIVGLNIPKREKLNDYTKEELSQILNKLDAIAPKQQVKYRKNLKLV